MKRDARIGLAVVLVLGLSVTMLIGRALYKRGGSSADVDGDSFASENSDAKSGLTDPGAGSPPAASNLLNPDAQRLLDQQSHPIDAPIGGGGQAPTPPPRHGDPAADLDHESVTPPNGGRNTQTAHTEYYAYTVVNGDSPWSIANKIFGDGKYTQKIVEANETSVKKMKAGTVLKIPSIANKSMQIKLQPYGENGSSHTIHDPMGGKPVAAEKNAPAPGAKGSTYKIETGDTLAGIAKKHYGSSGPKTIQLIVAANHGIDPERLKVGQEISLPSVKQ